jgi:ubiquinone/menaquinone biosynthesis C-methylase UbiE
MKSYNYKNDAEKYDSLVEDYNSYLHDLIFGMSFEFVKKGEKLLDIGIGTGLSSINFASVGLEIYGIDSSVEMLNECRKKSFAEELLTLDLNKSKIPFHANFFDHAICCGVLHFFGDLKKIFLEVTRVTKKGGIFAFTISLGELDSDFSGQMTDWDVPIFRHSQNYLERLLQIYGLKILKDQSVLTKGKNISSNNMGFHIIITEKFKQR